MMGLTLKDKQFNKVKPLMLFSLLEHKSYRL